MTTAMAAGLFERYDGIKGPEEKKDRKIELAGLERLLGKYEFMLEVDETDTTPTDKLLRAAVRESLTPEQINQFLQCTIAYENHPNYSTNTGDFVSRLIQNSFDAGNNGFHLSLRGLSRRIHYLCNIRGTPERIIEVALEGNAGNNLGVDAQNAIITLRGNAGDFCGQGSKNATFHLHGDVGENLGNESTETTFHLYKGFRLPIGPAISQFVVYSQKKYNRLCKALPPESTAILMDEKGKILARKKDDSHYIF